MTSQAKKERFELLFYEPVTPLHVGCGQDVGVVDLPVIRERTTGYPIIPGSGIRGAMRDRFEAFDGDRTKTLFGPLVEDQEEERYAGCVFVHDARLLLFPVRSDRGLFLWITCPEALRRFSREAELFLPGGASWAAPGLAEPADGEALAPAVLGSPLHLEELAFRLVTGEGDGGQGAADNAQALADWADRVGKRVGLPDLAQRTVLVSNRSFYHFVSHATVLTQHNRLDEAKTVEEGALFSLEAVPPAALFYGFLAAVSPRRKGAEGEEAGKEREVEKEVETPGSVLDSVWAGLSNKADGRAILTLGGHESTGLGVTRLVRVEAGS